MFNQVSQCLNNHSKASSKIQLTRNIVEQHSMLVQRFEQELPCKEMGTGGTLFYFVFIAWRTEIKDDLPDSDHIAGRQFAFARNPHMIDECAIGAIQVYN